MSEFYDLTVKNVRKETEECASVELDVPEELHKEFDFKQGQHIIFKKDLNGEELRRTYSLCTSPLDKEWRVCVKQIPEGKFSTFVNQELKAGDRIDAMAPTGKFGLTVEDDPEEAKNYIFFAAGSGITPILSMIKTRLLKEPYSTCQLIYLNRRVKTIIFKEELEQLRNKYLGRFELFHFLSEEQRNIPLLSSFDAEKIHQLTQNIIDIEAVNSCFISGPEDLTFMIRDELVNAGLAKNKIHYELFVTGLSEEDKKRAAEAMEKRYDGTKITVLDAGKEFHFTMTEEYDNVLDAALAAGADVSFACKGGVCSTCKCKLIDGSVEMKKNYALEEEELQQNYILSCQAVPTSEEVKVDYDA
jgi:ring-1,2-phenylacetyl-CoA epoxidase subunit PaaE